MKLSKLALTFALTTGCAGTQATGTASNAPEAAATEAASAKAQAAAVEMEGVPSNLVMAMSSAEGATTPLTCDGLTGWWNDIVDHRKTNSYDKDRYAFATDAAQCSEEGSTLVYQVADMTKGEKHYALNGTCEVAQGKTVCKSTVSPK